MTTVRVEGLYKVFGPRPTELVRQLQDGGDPDEIRAAGATAAVIDASFTITSGETFVVMGLSGSGKSTLIRMFNGLLKPTAGHVHIDDDDITEMSASAIRALRQSRMSMVFQHFALFPHRTVSDNTEYGLRIRGFSADERRTRAREALDMVGLSGWEDHYPQQLSGGMRQRVGLARALATHTDVLLMDEAFSALDPLIKREMQDQLIQLQARLGKTIIFITHDLNEAMRLGDRIAVMRAGRIVQIGDAEQILNAPADEYVARFVRDVDRSRVLTAASIAHPQISVPVDTLPADAAVLLRKHQHDRLFVTDEQQRLVGALSADAVERGNANGHKELHGLLMPVDDPVAHTAPINSLFKRMTSPGSTIAVIDQHEHFLGVITPEVLFSALAHPGGAQR